MTHGHTKLSLHPLQNNCEPVELTPSVQRRRVVIIARLEVLRFNNLDAFLGFDTFKNNLLVNALRNGSITTGFIIWIKPVWINRFPKGIIVKAFKPLLQVLLVFKFMHDTSVPHSGFRLEGKSFKSSPYWRAC